MEKSDGRPRRRVSTARGSKRRLDGHESLARRSPLDAVLSRALRVTGFGQGVDGRGGALTTVRGSDWRSEEGGGVFRGARLARFLAVAAPMAGFAGSRGWSECAGSCMLAG